MRKTTQVLRVVSRRRFELESSEQKSKILLLEPTCSLRLSMLIVLQYVDIRNLFLYQMLLGRFNQRWHRHAADVGEIGRHLVNPSLHEDKIAVPYYRKCVTLD